MSEYKKITKDQIDFMIESAKLYAEFHKELIRPDMSTCIIGECIEIEAIPPRKRTPRRIQIYYQSFSQSDQPKFLKAIIESLKESCPEFKDAFKYNCGRMD